MTGSFVSGSLIMLLTFACVCAAFVYGRQIGYTKRDAELAEEKRKEMEERYQELSALYSQLEIQYELEQKEKQRQAPKSTNGWEQFDIRG
ncbi:MAG: hypothetical protein IRZ03_18130 [Acidobacterium ailaaui]|nr:hypothetical protein [Pseudacidobacterium ailaaui]